MKSSVQLNELLRQIDGKSYPVYKSTRGEYQFKDYVLSIDHVQGDPFASPSKVSVKIKGKDSGFLAELYDKEYKKVALENHILRLMEKQIAAYSFQAKGSGKSGLIAITRCGQEVLQHSACSMSADSGDLLLGMEIGFPANGRTIQAKELEKILFEFLPKCVRDAAFYQRLDQTKVKDAVALAVDQHAIRVSIKERNLAAFVANGAILPRQSGVSLKPLKDAVPFQAPESMEITLQLPYAGTIKGMGIKKGISLIIGGGYHGKSTLLRALELGVYNHIRGDGREYVITDETGVKIRAEDGRSIKDVDISLFIRNLPNQKNTEKFHSEDASGSTSQAANVVESMEAGTQLLLIDEDTSATNFMIRDELMKRVVHADQEPIIPFIERMPDIYDKLGISIIMVAGSCGDYFHISHQILQMDHYRPIDVTRAAKKEAQNYEQPEWGKADFVPPRWERKPKQSFVMVKERKTKLKVFDKGKIQINRSDLDVSYVEQIVDKEQLRTMGYLLLYAERHLFDGKKKLSEVVEELYRIMERKGLSDITENNYYTSDLAMPRRQELFAFFNRYRELKIE